MLKSETREIGGKEYCVTQLGAEDGQRLFFKLLKFVGPSVAALLREWRGRVDEQGKPQLDVRVLSSALSEFMSQLSYGEFRDFVDTFMKSTALIGDADERGNKPRVNLDKMKALAFVGDYGSLVKWLGFCLEVNYSSFFADMGAMLPPNGAASAPSA